MTAFIRVIGALAFWALGVGFGIYGERLTQSMLVVVNKARARDAQISAYWWGWGTGEGRFTDKYSLVRDEYLRLTQDGALPNRIRRARLLLILSFAAAVACLLVR